MEQKFSRRWDELTKINFLQRKIILNSIAYYNYDKSFISDQFFNDISHQLVEMQANFKGNVEADTQYGYAMYDFDGSTGFDLFGKLTAKDREYLVNITEHYIARKSKPSKQVKTTNKRRLF